MADFARAEMHLWPEKKEGDKRFPQMRNVESEVLTTRGARRKVAALSPRCAELSPLLWA